MTIYRYKALGKDGTLQKGILEASSSIELKTYLHHHSLSLITYSANMSLRFSQKINQKYLIDFCLYLEQFENAGIPLKESLEELCHIQSMLKLKSILVEVIRDVEHGLLFSSALAKHPAAFDSVFVGLVAAGEKTGQFSFAYTQLFQHLKWVDEVKAQTLKAIRYPLITASVLVGVIFTLMTVLVPELIKFIQISTTTLPFSTRLIVYISKFLSTYIFYIIIFMGIVTTFSTLFFKCHPNGFIWKDRLLSQFPLIGPLRKRLCLARFCHIFAVLFGSGIDILCAIQTARRSLQRGQTYEAIKTVEGLVSEGFSLSEAFQKVGIFSPMVIRMVKVGEQTSSLQKTLFHVKEYFDRLIKRQVDHMIGLIEPFMVISVGLVMAWIIHSIFLPLYDTISILDH
ncbi:MAG: type II secretion system F family protein [Alphaproteobacteria bacterium]|nr:type II secretion system F family protein [Alphaproteobacteria bacterium]